MSRPSRREVLLAGAGALAGVAVVEGAHRLGDQEPSAAAGVEGTQDGRTPATGDTQAGVDRPVRPPTHLHFLAFTAPSGQGPPGALLASLGEIIGSLTAPEPSQVAADPADGVLEPGDLTVQIGLGAELLAHASTPAPDVSLPEFAGSAGLPEGRRGGDLFVLAAASRPEVAAAAVDRVVAALDGFTPRWSQIGYRPVGTGPVTRNPFGFEDGIVQPATAHGVPKHVWLDEGPYAGATIGVARRFTLDVAAFGRLDDEEQSAVFGRDRRTSVPLSGGSRDTDVNLGAKTPEGEYLVPADAHVRAAHPSFTDATVMLRRGYSFRDSVDGAPDRAGLLFLSYQDDVSVFARTQQRMDRIDRLMHYITPTAEAAFLLLPGFSERRPLGATLFG